MESESDDEEDNDEHGDEELHLILETGAYKRVARLDNRRYRDLRGDKGEDYYCVGAILKARLSEEEPNTREFLIKWSGWSSKDNTWEVESDLNGCIILLSEFCRLNRIKKT